MTAVRDLFPRMKVRLGADPWQPPTPAEQAASDAWQAHVNRAVDQFARTRQATIENACMTALRHGWDVHVHEPPAPFTWRRARAEHLVYLRCIGIEFTPAAHRIPTLHFHPAPDAASWDL